MCHSWPFHRNIDIYSVETAVSPVILAQVTNFLASDQSITAVFGVSGAHQPSCIKCLTKATGFDKGNIQQCRTQFLFVQSEKGPTPTRPAFGVWRLPLQVRHQASEPAPESACEHHVMPYPSSHLCRLAWR